jgi:hypothetical protein
MKVALSSDGVQITQVTIPIWSRVIPGRCIALVSGPKIGLAKNIAFDRKFTMKVITDTIKISFDLLLVMSHFNKGIIFEHSDAKFKII